MPGKRTTNAMFALRMLMEKYRARVYCVSFMCIRGPRKSLRRGSAERAVVLYDKIRNSRRKICATCTGYV